jgi:gluconokinase
MRPTGFLIMGVAGSGKTTVGKVLAEQLGWDFFDADDFHSAENISKMEAGIPLGDSDRALWLVALNQKLLSTQRENRHAVLACSALKRSYRSRLLAGVVGIAIVYLKGSYDLLWSRISVRQGHYMKSNMLQSQFDSLEEPGNALVLDIRQPMETMLDTIFSNYSTLKRSSK